MATASNMLCWRPVATPRYRTGRATMSSPMLCHEGMMQDVDENPAEAAPTNVAPPTLRAHVVKMLSAAILSGKYKPGDRLNESQIARELNISRIPVREALSQLQEQGLVQNRERRGMFVTDLGAEDVAQISSLRLILEAEALILTAARLTPDTLAQLEGLMLRMEAWNGSLL